MLRGEDRANEVSEEGAQRGHIVARDVRDVQRLHALLRGKVSDLSKLPLVHKFRILIRANEIDTEPGGIWRGRSLCVPTRTVESLAELTLFHQPNKPLAEADLEMS